MADQPIQTPTQQPQVTIEITGSTDSGKTALAVVVAKAIEEFGLDVIVRSVEGDFQNRYDDSLTALDLKQTPRVELLDLNGGTPEEVEHESFMCDHHGVLLNTTEE